MLQPLTTTQKMTISGHSEPIILCAADDNYVKPLAVTLHSAATHLRTNQSIKAIVLDGGISEENWMRLKETFVDLPIEVFSIRPNLQEVKELAISHHITHTAYFRLFAGRLLPDNIDKVIYLDSDLLIQDDLCQIWDEPLDDQLALAVPDVACPFIDSRYAECNFAKSSPYFASISPVGNWKELGLDPEDRYFNSGVMVLNIKRMREEFIGRQLLDCLRQNPKYVWCWDQYALNVVFAKQWRTLPLKWNQGAHFFEYPDADHAPVNNDEFLEARHRPSIVHYTTEWKPWDYDSSHPLKDRFFQQLDQTAWSGWRPEKPEFSIVSKWQAFATEFVKQWVIHYRKIVSTIVPPRFTKPSSALSKITTTRV